MNSESFVRAVEALATWAWRASWQGAALAAVVAVVLWAVGRRISPAWRFGLWGLVLVRLAMPAVVAVAWKDAGRAEAGATPRRTVPVVVSSHGVAPTAEEMDALRAVEAKAGRAIVKANAPSVGTGSVDSVTPWAQLRNVWPRLKPVLIWTWLAGALLLAMRIAWSSLRLARAVSRMRPITDPRLLDALRACCGEMGIARVPQARELPVGCAPALVGCVRPRVLLPMHVLEAMGRDELRLILLHELAHVRRRDVLVNWLGTIVALIHWPNPAAWLVLWRMRAERELACDELVLRVGRDAGGTAYARTIVKLVETLSAGGLGGRVPAALPGGGAVGILEGKAQIQRRLLMIAQYDGKGRRWPVVAAGLGLLVGALALSGVTRAADGPGSKPAATPGAPRSPGSAPAAREGSTVTVHDAAPADGHDPAVAVKETRAVGGAPGARVSDDEQAANARTAAKLKQPIKEINFAGTSLGDVIEYVRDVAGVDVLVQWESLNGVNKDSPVNLRLREPASAEAVLSLVFRSMGGEFNDEIDKGVLVISGSGQRPALVTRVYDVSDLVTGPTRPAQARADAGTPGAVVAGSHEGAAASGHGPGAAAGGGSAPAPAAATTGNDEMDQLIKLVMSTVQPDVWAENGGIASMGVFKAKLVVKAPEGTHKELTNVLEMLREKPAGKTEKPR